MMMHHDGLRACHHVVAVVSFHALPTGPPLVVKIDAGGGGYPFRARVVVISGGCLPSGWLGCLSLFSSDRVSKFHNVTIHTG